MRILVTGASGLSGSFAARALADDGFDVVGVYRRDTAFLAPLHVVPRLHLIRADIINAGDLPGPFDAIVHVGATSPAPGVTIARIVRDNVDGTLALIDAALSWKACRFVFFSSLSLYGEITREVVDETTPICNPDPYGIAKYLAELRLAEVAEVMPALSLRLPGILGPGAHRNWLSSVAAALLSGRPIGIYHQDRPFNNAAHVSDISALVAGLLRRGWEGFDAVVLGARGMTTVRGAVDRLAHGLGISHVVSAVAPKKPSFTLSSERAITRYGYDPMDIEALIERYARDLRSSDGFQVAQATARTAGLGQLMA